jgi:hypothetical protein
MPYVLDGFLWLRYFLDLKVLGGYDTTLNREDPFAEYRSTFGKRPHKEVPEDLKFWIEDTVSKIGIDSVGFSFRDFVSFRDAWALPGVSVQGKAKKVTFVGSDKSRASLKLRNKYFALAHLSDEQIYRNCKAKVAYVKPFVKQDEPAACRTVQCYDTYSLIRCSYLEQALGNLNLGGLWTTVGMNSKKKLALRKRIFSGRCWWLCTDQSNFDTNQPLSWIFYAVECLFRKIVKANPHMRDVCECELESLKNVMIQDGHGGTFRWGNGILSGYKFTALLDSILNRAETRVVLGRLGMKPIFEVFQGDDALVGFREKPDKSAVALQYSKLGLVVNPSKTWVSHGDTEYLHEVYYQGGVFGFPARSFKAVAWASPNTGSGSSVGEMKLRSLLSSCLMCIRRGLDVVPILRKVMSSYGLVDKSMFDAWFSTPTWFGGFGAGMTGRVSLTVQTLRDNTFRTYIPGIWGGKLYKEAAKLRIESACPLPGIRNTYGFDVVRGSASMPFQKVSEFVDVGSVRTDWEVSDLAEYSDSFTRKLTLEWKLKHDEEILPTDLPNGFLKLARPDKAYRRYRSMVSRVLLVETELGTTETYSRYSAWANGAWAGISLLWALGSVDLSVDFLRKQLCMTMLKLLVLPVMSEMLVFIRV